MRILFVDYFIGPALWRGVGERLEAAARVDHLPAQGSMLIDSTLVALASYENIVSEVGPAPYDLVVGEGANCGPIANAVLAGLAKQAVIIDPEVVNLLRLTMGERAEAVLDPQVEEILSAVDARAEDFAQGDVTAAVEGILRPAVSTRGDERFLELLLEAVETKGEPSDPPDSSLEGKRLEDWTTPWASMPGCVHLWWSEPPSQDVQDALASAGPRGSVRVWSWGPHSWLDEPTAMSEALAAVLASGHV